MSFTAFVLIFLSVFLHAAWNFLSKKGNPSGAFYLLMGVAGTVITFFALPLSDLSLSELPGKFWLFLAGSFFFEMFYNLGLAYGYRAADISLIYPMGRAMPVLLIAAVSMLLGIGERPGGTALAGMLIIFSGCILMPLKNFKSFSIKTYCTKAIFFVLLIAVGTTGYTIMDSQAEKVLQMVPQDSRLMKSILHLFFIELGLTLGLGAYVMLVPWERQELKRIIKQPGYPVIAGIFSAVAYVLVLVAMGFVTNVSFVQAFRQLSLPLGVFAGIVFLKESPAKPKLLGVALIVLGLILTVL